MNEETYEKLTELVLTRMDEALELEPDSPNVRMIDDSIIKMAGILNDASKIQNDYYIQDSKRADEVEKNALDATLKRQQMKKDDVHQTIKHVLEGLGITVSFASIGAAVWTFVKSMKFEETGTISSQAGRKVLGELIRFKK